MKKSWWLIPCLMVVLVLGAVGCASGGNQGSISITPQQNGIWVTGQGEAMAVPDIAELRLGVETRADTVAEAQTQASEAMDRVMQALQDNGVDEKDIQTWRFSIYPITRWIGERGEEQITGYRVTNLVLAKIREVDKADIIIDAVAEAGGDFIQIQGISFSVDDLSPYYEEARAKAVEEAKDKAAQLAELAGVTLGKPTYISEGTIQRPETFRNLYAEAGSAAPAPETPISPGELKITLSIQIAYAIV